MSALAATTAALIYALAIAVLAATLVLVASIGWALYDILVVRGKKPDARWRDVARDLPWYVHGWLDWSNVALLMAYVALTGMATVLVFVLIANLVAFAFPEVVAV